MSPQTERVARRLQPLELSTQGEQSPADTLREMAERWNDFTSLAGRSLAEKYLAGRFSLICDLNIFPVSGDLDEGAAIGDSRQLVNDKRVARLVFTADVPDALKMDLGNEEFVLVQNVETVKLPDGTTIPSSVWLYNIQNEVADLFGGLMFKSAVDGVFHFLPGVANRKAGVLTPLPGGGELNIAGRIVKGGTQIVDRVSDNAHQPLRNTLKRNDAEAIVAAVRIMLDGDLVRESALVGGQFRIEFVDVLFGPHDL